MINIIIDRTYGGPTLVELGYLLDEGTEPVTAAWRNTRTEMEIIRAWPDRDFTLILCDASLMERTCVLLGLRYVLQPDMVQAGVSALNSAVAGAWRPFTNRVGSPVSRSVFIQAIADRIRRGKDAPALRKLAVDCVLDGTPVIDMDVLFGLRMTGARV